MNHGYKKISDYGIIGNLHSAALVGLDCSIDWLCLPHIDSPGIFTITDLEDALKETVGCALPGTLKTSIVIDLIEEG